MPTDAAALVDAADLFLARHDEALAAGDPARGIEACASLAESIGTTLAGELERADPGSPARSVVERRAAELEGLALQLKLAFHQLEAREVDVLRLVALLSATRRQVRALRQVLALWGAAQGGPAPREAPAADALRAAREALGAGCAIAAREALRVALARSGRTHDVGAGDDLVGAWRALDEVEALLLRVPSPTRP